MYTDKDIEKMQNVFECEHCQAMHLLECACPEDFDNCDRCGDEIELGGTCECCEMDLRENF